MVPPTNNAYNPIYPQHGELSERIKITKKLNDVLKSESINNNLLFFDVYDLYSDEEGKLNEAYSDKNVHIGIHAQHLLENRLNEIISSVSSAIIKMDTTLRLQYIKSESSSISPDFLKELKNLFNINTFIETGTYLGDTAEAASNIFDKVFTVELSNKLYINALNRFENKPNVTVLQGNSPAVLSDILKNENRRILFWLDAHYSEGSTAKGESNTPIIDELKAIRNSGINEAIILIDDIRIFQESNENTIGSLGGYPTVSELQRAIHDIREDSKFIIFGDIAIGICTNQPIEISPVLEACTVSRAFDGNNYNLEEVLDAEKRISQSDMDEKDTLQKLAGAYVSSEKFGVGGHYHLWNGLILYNDTHYSLAKEEFIKAKQLGCSYWRTDWYLAWAAYRAGNIVEAQKAINSVVYEAPDFEDAGILFERLYPQTEQSVAASITDVLIKDVSKINADSDILTKIKVKGLWDYEQPLRLHLGCGQNHFDGYINIDYPPSEHNVMKVKADISMDITELNFPEESVDEIRSHHVFEHFNRVTALALLIKWHRWLKIGGKLHIETPDIIGCAKTLLSDSSWKTKTGNIRHIAGDQAAEWGYHIEHWFPERFDHTLSLLGYSNIQTQATSWSVEPFLSNVTVTAYKSREIPLPEQLAAADTLLWESTVADSEKATYEIWRKQLRAVLDGNSCQSPINAKLPELPSADEIHHMLSSKASTLSIAEIHNFNQNDRDKWVRSKATSVPAGSRVLDIGAGTCPYRTFFAHCEYKTHDFKKYTGGKLGGTTEYGTIDYESDITEIPVPDNSFDVILCTEVLEHASEPIKALQKMSRILKPGGRLLLTAPLGCGLHQLPYHYYGGFTPEWYKLFCNKFGLTVTEITPNGGFFKLLAQECARVAWTLPQHKHLHGSKVEFISNLFGKWIPRYLFALEDKLFIDQFTVGYHVEAIKPSGLISNKDVNAVSTILPEEIGTKSASYNQHAQDAVGVVFSKDRPLQLDAALRSFFLHCQDADTLKLNVLYTISDMVQQELYAGLISEYTSVTFIKEQDFRKDLLSLLSGPDYILFLVDDNIFVRDFSIADVIKSLSDHPDALGFSLRLGSNTTYCYSRNKNQKLPEFQIIKNNILKYNWTSEEYDFGYPLEVSSSVYRASEIVPFINGLPFYNPNSLEGLMSVNRAMFKDNRPFLLCFNLSATFCAPLNKVQDTCAGNRASDKPEYSTVNLTKNFSEGYRIDVSAYNNFLPNACHQEVVLKLVQLMDATRQTAFQRGQELKKIAESSPHKKETGLTLPSTTLVCIDCCNHELSIRALEHSMRQCGFDRIVFFTDRDFSLDGIDVMKIPTITTKEQYSRFVIKELNKYIHTDFILMIQYDGFIINPEAWSDEFLKYDYIGDKWHWYHDGFNVGNGGFSLRSKRLMQALSDESINASSVEYGEDTLICRTYRSLLENKYGIKFAPENIADRFSYERSADFRADHPFGFHGLFNMWRYMRPEHIPDFISNLSPKTLNSVEAFELAMSYHNSGQLKTAETIYRKILEFNPGNIDALKALNQTGSSSRTIKTGRNEPCPCGSGKKYKKCCGGGRHGKED